MEMKSVYEIALIFLISHLVIFAKDYKGAELRTKATVTYGRFEVNYKASYGAGQTSTFFTYHELGSAGVDEWNELDIEILGRYTDDVQFNPITPGQVNHEHHQWVDFDPTADFHTYAIEWTPDYVAWFVEGQEVHRQTGDHITALNRDQKIMMNIWPPAYTSWVGNLDTRMLPFFAYYDWVSYASHTPGSGNIGTGNNFTHQWRDDFDSWDTNRWAKASHTWNGNNSDFIPENCVFQNGKMILCLTDGNNIGYTDKNKPFMAYARYEADTVLIAFSEEITQESTEVKGNYVISGVTIEKAIPQENRRLVKLVVKGIDKNSSYSLVVLGIKDFASPPNSLLGQLIAIQMPPQWDYSVKINVGGDNYNEWLGDQEWEDDRDYGQIGGADGHFSGQPISGTTDDIIYQSEQRGLVKYQVQLPKGNYDVTLMLAENYFSEAGRRLMDINLEGEYVARNLDLVSEVGIHAAYTINVPNVSILDGILDIHFGNNKDYSLLNGIIIDQIETGIEDNRSSILNDFQLAQNYPNPFNPITTIAYRLKEPSAVSIRIFNLLGNEIATLIDTFQLSGNYKVDWYANVPGGIYFYRMNARSYSGSYSETKKMLLIK